MEILFLLIPASLLLAGIALAFFLWAVRTGQFDDLDTPPHRILFEDRRPGVPASGRPLDPHRAAGDEDAADAPGAPADGAHRRNGG